MRQYTTFGRIFLILSIINFARAAPVAIREVHEVHVNVVDVAEDGTATSQKRWDSEPKDDYWLANAADQTRAPLTPRLPDLDHFGLHSPRSSTGLNNAPSSSTLSTGPHPRASDALTPASSVGSVNYPPISGPGQSFTSGPSFSWQNRLPADNSRPSSPAISWPHELPANPSSPPISWPHELPADKSHPSSPAISWPHELPAVPRPGFSWPDELPAVKSRPPNTDHPPPSSLSTGPPQSAIDHPPSSSEPPRPTVPETKDLISQLEGSEPSRIAYSEPKEFLGLLLKGRIKPRMSGSGAVNSAQESQATIDPKSTLEIF